jgi:hypothetical protein
VILPSCFAVLCLALLCFALLACTHYYYYYYYYYYCRLLSLLPRNRAYSVQTPHCLCLLTIPPSLPRSAQPLRNPIVRLLLRGSFVPRPYQVWSNQRGKPGCPLLLRSSKPCPASELRSWCSEDGEEGLHRFEQAKVERGL